MRIILKKYIKGESGTIEKSKNKIKEGEVETQEEIDEMINL